MSSFGCCIWWFLFGVLLGWLLNRWLCKCACSKPTELSSPTPSPVAKVADVPAVAAPVKKATPTKKATPVKKAAPTKRKPAPAKTLAIDLKAARAAGFKIKSADDLTVIEGIGPKINGLFKDAGLKTFAKVATATVPQMRKILDDAGPRYRIANPSTWAKQAKLAAGNKWAALNKLQDELSGGIKK